MLQSGTKLPFHVGNIASISNITTPALLRSHREDDIPPGLIAKQWRNLFEIGKSQAPPIGATVAASFFYLAWSVRSGTPLFKKTPYSRSALYSTAAVLTLSIVPFTILAMSSTNNQLLEKADSTFHSSDTETVDLIQKWTTLNRVRSFLPLAGAFCGFVASFV